VCFWGLPSKTCDRLNDVLIHLYWNTRLPKPYHINLDMSKQCFLYFSGLKKELEVVKKSGARADISNSNAKMCARCHEDFGLLINTGAFCPKCKARVCKTCRTPWNNTWLCTFCGKVR
jgi:synaptotagmin-like protein